MPLIGCWCGFLAWWTSRGQPCGSCGQARCLRRKLMALSIRRGFAAMARSDLDLVLQGYEPDVEVWMRGMSGVGIGGCYRGHEGVRVLYADVDGAFEAWSWTIRAVVDGGDRLAIRADFLGVGRGSGVSTTLVDSGTAMRLSERGAVSWQEWFVEQNGWQKALEAAGLSDYDPGSALRTRSSSSPHRCRGEDSGSAAARPARRKAGAGRVTLAARSETRNKGLFAARSRALIGRTGPLGFAARRD